MMKSTPSQARPTPLACIQCRKKHLKCDAISPRCGRCAAEGLQCVYTPSRRGYGRRKANGERTVRRGMAYAGTTSAASPDSDHRICASSLSPGPNTLTDESERSVAVGASLPPTPASTVIQALDNQHLIQAYYTWFHPSHPFLVPHSAYSEQRYPDYLQATIYFVAHRYLTSHPDNVDSEGTLKIMLAPENDEMTVSRVQALVLYAIILHSLHCPQEAMECVRRARHIADVMKFNCTGFTSLGVAPASVEEESIRRTWWELYIVEAYLAALHLQPSFLSKPEDHYPLLPITEEAYASGACDIEPPSLRSFENRAFAKQPIQNKYSSSCYRIEAICILRRFLNLSFSNTSHPDDIQAFENAIAGWKYYLPASGVVIDDFGEMDSLLFQAHFFIHSASILFHFPRSDLPLKVPSAAEISCVKSHKPCISSGSRHTMKAIAASKEISRMAADLSNTDSCPPFFICALILACVVQLAATVVHSSAHSSACYLQHRDRIILLLGVISKLGQRWPVATDALQPLRLIADTIFGANHAEEIEISPQPSLQDELAAAEDVLAGTSWFDLFNSDELMALP